MEREMTGTLMVPKRAGRAPQAGEEERHMHKQAMTCAAMSTLLLSGLASASYMGSYSNDFSGGGGGNHFGTSYVTTAFGHSDLQLVSDGQSGTHGTWTTGDSSFANKSLTAFSASFNFSFNTNGNGGLGDGFSFVFGDLSDMSGDRWAGGEYGLNAFAQDGEGMSIGFDTYGGDSGIHARWGGSSLTWNNFGTEWWNYANENDYNSALTDANQGSILIEWDINSGLDVYIDWGDDPIPGYYHSIDTGFYSWPDGFDMTGWDFGFAGRNGGIDNDILIDNFNVSYNYIPTPGVLALLGLAGIHSRRRRRD
jgi:hypothetical protein